MSADRELLFGILALQNGLIDRDTLLAAFQTWMKDKSKPLAQILQHRNSGSPEEFELLNRLVQLHINKHGQDPQQSLASLSNLAAITTQLQQLGDADINATLIGIDQSSNVEYSVAASLNPERTFIPGKGQRHASGTSSGKSRFRILRPHARGGLGEVFVAQDEELNRNVALKEIQSQFSDHPDSRSRFVLEAEVTGGLEHPGIVPVYGLGQYEDGRPYYAMRFIKGDSLKEAIDSFHKASTRTFATASGEKIADGPDGACLSPTAFLSVDFRKLLGRFIDVCQAVSYAHSRGVLHRDLKPGNIMLGKYGETLVVDWGLAKIQGRDEATSKIDETTLTPTSGSGVTPTVMGSAIATPAYMPPEQAAGKLNELGPASDVYSLGATLYHLLTGQAPFRGKNVVDLLKDVQSGTFPAPSSIITGIPKALDAICLKAMSLAPCNRYASPQNLADDIEKFLADEPVSAFAEPLMLRARRWVRKNQTLATTTAAVMMVSAIGMGVFSTVVSGKNSELKTVNQNLIDSNARERDARTLAETNEKSAKEQSQLALSTLTSVITDIQRGLKGVPGSGEVRRRLLQSSLEKLASVSKTFLEKAVVDRSNWLALIEMGDLILTFGNGVTTDPSLRQPKASFDGVAVAAASAPTAEQLSSVHLAESYYQRAFQITKSLAEAVPGDAGRQRDLALSYWRLSDVFLRLGRKGEALNHCQEGMKIYRGLAEADRDNVKLQHELTVAFVQLGDVFFRLGRNDDALTQFQDGLKISRVLAKSNPNDADKQHGLSIFFERLGDIFLKVDRIDDALKQYEECFKIRRILAESAPNDAAKQLDLSISFNKMGNVFLKLGRTNDALTQYEGSLRISRVLAEADPNDAQKQRNLSISSEKLGDVFLRLGRTEDALTQYEGSLRISRVLAEADPSAAEKQRDLSISCEKLGDFFLEIGRADDALKHYAEGLKIHYVIAAADPNDIQTQRDVAALMHKLGKACMTLGRADDALKHYAEGLKIHYAIAAADPNDIQTQRDLSTSLNRLGNVYLEIDRTNDALIQFEADLRVNLVLAEVNPNDTEIQRDLSISFNSLGAVFLKLGRNDEALNQFEEGLKIRRMLAEADPNNPQKQRDLSISFNKLGEVFMELGRNDDALNQFDADLKISRMLAETDPNNSKNQRDLSISFNNVGNVLLKLGRNDDALKQFEEGFKIRRMLAEADPGNAQKQRDLSISCEKLGDLLLKLGRPEDALRQFDADLKISRVLAEADPNNAEKQRDLSVSLNRLGDVFLKLGRNDDALNQFEEGFKIRRVLSETDPNNAAKQRDLSISLDNLGSVSLRMGRTDEALKHYENSLTISRLLVEADPGDEQSLRDLKASYYTLGNVRLERDEFELAAESFEMGAAILRRLMEQGSNNDDSKNELVTFESSSKYASTMEEACGDWGTLLLKHADQLPALLEARSIHFTKRSQFGDAAQAAIKLMEQEAADDRQNYNAACVLCLSAATIKAVDGIEPTPEQADRRQEWINAAIVALKKSIAKGYSNFDYMLADADLTILRDLPEFKALIPPKEAMPEALGAPQP